MALIAFSIGASVAIFALSLLFYWSVFLKIGHPSRYIYSSCVAYVVYNMVSVYNLGKKDVDDIVVTFFTGLFQYSGALVLCLAFYWIYFANVNVQKKIIHGDNGDDNIENV